MIEEKKETNEIIVSETIKEENSEKTQNEIVKENKELEESLKPKLDENILSRLKARKKEEPMSTITVAKRDRSLYFGVVGLGQAGSRIAETFYSLGYEACVMNTATQDLEFIQVPDNRKLFLPFALGGAGKELDNGRAAIEQNNQIILDKVNSLFDDKHEMILLAVSGGGGTGSGGAESMVELLSTLGKPVGVIYVLPMDSEDSLSKHNAVTTLGKLAKLASTDVVTTLIVVDNAKIELLYQGMSKAEFWPTANNAIVEPLHLFNHLSATATPYDSLDSMDFGRIFTAGDCTIFGTIEVENYMETTAIAEAVMDNLEDSLLASDFDLKEARFGGFIVTGNAEILRSLPAENIHYAQHMISEACDYAQLFKGVYELPVKKDVVKIYTMFSGLGLPAARIDALKEEAKQQMERISEKEKSRASHMIIDYGEGNETKQQAKEIRRKITQKKSGFGKLTNNANRTKVIDRRKR